MPIRPEAFRSSLVARSIAEDLGIIEIHIVPRKKDSICSLHFMNGDTRRYLGFKYDELRLDMIGRISEVIQRDRRIYEEEQAQLQGNS